MAVTGQFNLLFTQGRSNTVQPFFFLSLPIVCSSEPCNIHKSLVDFSSIAHFMQCCANHSFVENSESILSYIARGRFDIAIAPYTLNPHRRLVVDFLANAIPINRVLLVDKTQFSGVGFTHDALMFLKPFTINSWKQLLLVVVVLGSCVFLSDKLDFEGDGYRGIILSINVFVLLINAYYGGTMTMYFASGDSEPFLDLEDALSKYPEWEMLVPKDSAFFFRIMADSGLPNVDAWVRRADQSPKELLKDTTVLLTSLIILQIT